MPLVIGNLIGEIVSATQHQVINERQPCRDTSSDVRAIAVEVVLPSYKVPCKITPVHIVDLIAKEELQILHKSRLGEVSFATSHPAVVTSNMVRIRRISPWEEGLIGVNRLLFRIEFDIAIGFVGVRLGGCAYHLLLGFVAHHFGCKRLPIEQGPIAILLPIEILLK